MVNAQKPQYPPGMKTRNPALKEVGYKAGSDPCCFFDIVNGFLIDAVVHWFIGKPRLKGLGWKMADASLTDVTIWLRLSSTSRDNAAHARLSLMVWILKREVRAFGGCLGTYRR